MGADEGGGDRESRLGACFEGAQTVGGREGVSGRKGGTGEVKGDEGASFL